MSLWPVRELGLPRIRLHDLRHTHATLALAAGIHPKVVQEPAASACIAGIAWLYRSSVMVIEECPSRIAALIDVTA